MFVPYLHFQIQYFTSLFNILNDGHSFNLLQDANFQETFVSKLSLTVFARGQCNLQTNNKSLPRVVIFPHWAETSSEINLIKRQEESWGVQTPIDLTLSLGNSSRRLRLWSHRRLGSDWDEEWGGEGAVRGRGEDTGHWVRCGTRQQTRAHRPQMTFIQTLQLIRTHCTGF